MTNEKILATPEAGLGPIERQKQVLILIAQQHQRYPVCAFPSDVFQAAGIALNEYPFGMRELE
jgi:hypothetical protein